VAYRAEIEIGVKGVKQLNNFQAQLERLSNEVDRVNKKKFTVANLSSYSEALRRANETLSQTEIETNKAGKATGLYEKNLNSFVTALLASKDAQELNNKLVQDEIQKRGAATQALKAYNAELAAPTKRGTQTTMSGAYLRGQPSLTPALPPDFNAVAAAARTRASSLAQVSIQAGKAAQANAISQRKTQEIRQNLAGARLSLEGMVAANKNMLPILQQAVELAEKQLRISKQGALVAGRFSPVQGDANTPGSPLFLEAQRERRKNALSNALIGGAFPLLFGQGGGAAIGGALGGGAGGLAGGQFGFALSLVGTQIGAFVDQVVSGAANLGQALNVLTADIDAVIAASGKSNTAFAANVKALEEAGLKNTALELATQQLALAVGGQGVSALKEFGSDTQELSRSFATSMSLMQSAVANVINSIGILKGIAAGLESFVVFQQAKRTQGEDPVLKELFEERKTARSAAAIANPFGVRTRGEVDADIINRRKKLNLDEAKNILGLTTLALLRKKNLDESKRQLSNQQQFQSVEQTTSKILDQQTQAQQAKARFDEQRNNIVLNYEKGLANLRRSVENQVSGLRLQNLKKANQLEDQRASNALAQLKNQQAASQLFNFSAGASNPLLQKEAETLKAASDAYQLKIVETEQQRAKLEKDSALTVESIQLRADKFKLDVARQSAELALNAQNQINKINKNILERNAKFTVEKFNIEKTLASLRLQVLRRELEFENQKLQDQAKTAKGDELRALEKQSSAIGNLDQDLVNSIQALDQVEAPSSINEVAGIEKASVSLVEYNRLTGESIALQEKFGKARLEALNLALEAEGIKSLTAASDLLKNLQIEVVNGLAQQTIEQEKSLRITELTRQLGSKAIAEEIAGIEFSTKAQMAKLDLVASFLEIDRARLELKRQDIGLTDQEIAQLERITELEEHLARLRGQVTESAGISKKQAKAKGELSTFIEQATLELNNLEAVGVRVAQGIGDAVGNSLTNGIVGLISGTQSAKEVFANFLSDVGQILAQEGAKMIATYIAIGVAKIFAGLGSATAGGGSSVETITSKYGSFGAEGAAKAAGSLPPLPKANGGPVESGRPYLVGERGPEMFIPGSSGGIMRNEDMRQMMGRSPAGVGAPQMNFTFETTNIGGTEFVSREQLEVAMSTTRRQAASDGAKQGMSMTLDKMQNSPRTRSRVGIR